LRPSRSSNEGLREEQSGDPHGRRQRHRPRDRGEARACRAQ
jgi:hypothetical protein